MHLFTTVTVHLESDSESN